VSRSASSSTRWITEKRLAAASLRRCEPRKRKQRLWGALARRGFDTDTIRQALEDLPGLHDDEASAGDAEPPDPF
jgi:SOS response regulatory protein OraA/RecX